MSDINTISPEVKLIQDIGDEIVKFDVMRFSLSRESAERKQLDTLRDRLDTYQRSLVRNGISTDTDKFKQLTTSLQRVNDELTNSANKLTSIADRLKNIVKFVEVVEKIVSLIPK